MIVLAALGDAPTAVIAVVAILLGIVVVARGQRGRRADEDAGPSPLAGVGTARAGGDDAEDGLEKMAPHDVGRGTIRLRGVASADTEPEAEPARVPAVAPEPEPVVAAEPETAVESEPLPEPEPEREPEPAPAATEREPASWTGARAGQWTAPPVPAPAAAPQEPPAVPEEPPSAPQPPPTPGFRMGRIRFRKPPSE